MHYNFCLHQHFKSSTSFLPPPYTDALSRRQSAGQAVCSGSAGTWPAPLHRRIRWLDMLAELRTGLRKLQLLQAVAVAPKAWLDGEERVPILAEVLVEPPCVGQNGLSA